MKADVTEGPDKLMRAIGDDSDAVICATGFRPGWNLFAPWQVVILLFLLSTSLVVVEPKWQLLSTK